MGVELVGEVNLHCPGKVLKTQSARELHKKGTQREVQDKKEEEREKDLMMKTNNNNNKNNNNKHLRNFHLIQNIIEIL